KSYFWTNDGVWLGAGLVCPAGTRLTWTGAAAVPDGAAGDCANAIEAESAISTCPKMVRILMIPSLPSELQDFRPTRRRHIQPEWVDAGLPFFRRRVQRDCERALPVVRGVHVSIQVSRGFNPVDLEAPIACGQNRFHLNRHAACLC